MYGRGIHVTNLHICVVEDDPNIQHIVKSYLKNEQYEVTVRSSAEEAVSIWKETPPDMWILDIMLPGMDGYTFCKKVRQQSDVPIIIISAKDDEVDKIIGLELGSDDYLTKPFSPRELVARVKRLFARTKSVERPGKTTYTVGSVELYVDERRVFEQNEEVDVTTKEYELLYLFIEHPKRAFSREDLLMHIWGNDYYGSDRAVDDLVKRLRKKIPSITIETIWGFGYRLGKEVDRE